MGFNSNATTNVSDMLFIYLNVLSKKKSPAMGILRFFHTSLRYQSEKTSAMAILRKKTGYTLSNIRKALELHENDVDKAEKWLAEQAKALGWSKVMKLQDRQAIQGLIGIAVENKKVAMVEVNCETDFVSKTDKFKSLVELVAKACLQQSTFPAGVDTHKAELNAEELGKLHIHNNSLADELALFIGSVGENAVLKRGFCYETSNDDVKVAVAVHPPSQNSGVLLGQYGAFISYQRNSEASHIDKIEDIASDICTHIIAADPVKIGEYGKDEPSENGVDESVLIHQDFVLDDTVTIGQILTDSGLKILDFKRFQCGESSDKNNLASSDSGEHTEQLNEAKA